MNTFFDPWTLDEAAAYLSERTGKTYTERDILRLGYDRKVSVVAPASCDTIVVATEDARANAGTEVPVPARGFPRISARTMYSLLMSGAAEFDGWELPVGDEWRYEYRVAPGAPVPVVHLASCRVNSQAVVRLADEMTRSSEPVREGGVPPTQAAANRAAHDMDGERGMRLAVLTYWDEIASLHGHGAGAKQILRVLERKGYTSKEKTIGNVCGQLRKEGLIP